MRCLLLVLILSACSSKNTDRTFSNSYAVYHCHTDSVGKEHCVESRASGSYYK